MKLLVVTNSYPFGIIENFLETEIPYLARRFSCVYVFPINPGGEQTRVLPPGVELIRVKPRASPPKGALILGRIYTFSHAIRDLPMDFANPNLRKKPGRYFRNFFRFVKGACEQLPRFQKSLEILSTDAEPFIVYHYWCNSSVWIMDLAAKFAEKTIYQISRAHGYDLYSHRTVFPLRLPTFRILKTIFPVSEDGHRHLSEFARNITPKLRIARLGIQLPRNLGPRPRSDEFRILTLSYLTALKRLHRLAYALHEIRGAIQWMIIGDGDDRQRLEEAVARLPAQVSVEFLGHLPSESVHERFRTQAFNLLVNLSYSEGVPVSMMEALSYGIPILGTAVGGVPEIISNDVGWLLPPNPSPHQIRDAIEIVREESRDESRTISRRLACRAAAERKWNAKINFAAFAETLCSLPIA